MSPMVDEKMLLDKQPLLESEPRQNHAFAFRNRLIRRILPAIITLVATFTLFRSLFVCDHHYRPDGSESSALEEPSSNKIELEAHGMSRCPDYADCLRELIVPTMIQVGDKVNFTLSFIGR